MFKNRANRQILPGMPTIAEAAENHILAVTDQAAMFYQIEIPRSNIVHLNILCVTALTSSSPNGLYPTNTPEPSDTKGDGDREDQQQATWETEEQAGLRYNALVGRLRKIATNSDPRKVTPCVILLQQIDEALLRDRFNLEDWTIEYQESTAIAYRNNIFFNTPEFVVHDSGVPYLQAQVHVSESHSVKTIRLYNLDQAPGQSPLALCDQYDSLLTEGDAHYTIIAGQLGAGIAPVKTSDLIDGERTNIATGLMPLTHADQTVQMPRFTQGCFVRSNGLTIQLDGTPVSLEQNRRYLGRFNPNTDTTHRQDPFQAMLLLDLHYSSQVVEEDRKDYIETAYQQSSHRGAYQDYLGALLEDTSIEVWLASNSINNRAIGIWFSGHDNLHLAVHEKVAHFNGVQLQEIGGRPCLFVPMLRTKELHQAIQGSVPKYAVINWIDERIIQLRKAKGIVLKKGDAKIDELLALRELIDMDDLGNMDFETIHKKITTWEAGNSEIDGKQEEHRRNIMNARRLRLPEVHMPKLSRGTTTPNDDGSLEDSFSSVENNQTRLTKTGEELRDLLRQVDYSHRELAQKHLRPFLEPSRWERIRRGHPMLRSGNQKTKLFYQLNSRIEQEDRDVSAEDLNQIVSDWSNQESEDPTTHNQVTNLTLLSQVRLRFLGNISDPEQGMTRSQKAITDMQAALGRRS